MKNFEYAKYYAQPLPLSQSFSYLKETNIEQIN